MRKCRFCQQEIADASRTCEHCGRDLFPGRTPTPNDPALVTVAPAEPTAGPTTVTKTCPFCAEEIQPAAIVCKHCGRDLVVTAPLSPPATMSSSTTSTQIGRAVLITFGLLCLLGIGSAVMSTGGGSSASNPTPSKLLNVTVRHGLGVIEITNAGSEDAAGREMNVYINGDPPFTFKAIATVPPLGKSVQLPLREFTQKDGTRFNPIATAVTVIWVGGNSYDYRSFGK